MKINIKLLANSILYILIFSLLTACENLDLEKNLNDFDIPTSLAKSIHFDDMDNDKGEIAGQVHIMKADNENNITAYVLYFGTDEKTKQSNTPIGEVLTSEEDPTFTFSENTPFPIEAEYLLVFTKNQEGESKNGTATALVDVGVPYRTATGIFFTDTDVDGGELAGEVTIEKADNEENISHYVLYWGSDSHQNRISISTLAKNGNDLKFYIAENTIIPTGITHLLLYTRNKDGEAKVFISRMIDDTAVPNQQAGGATFKDSDKDGGQIGGILNINKAADEKDITHYILYWGTSPTEKKANGYIDTIAKSNSNFTYTFSENTRIPDNVAYFLIFARNDDGEGKTGISTPIDDLGVPEYPPLGITFLDTDENGGEITGTLTISRAVDESDITSYGLYWGLNPTTKLDITPIVIIPKSKEALTYVFPAHNNVPSYATHFLAFSRNSDGEMRTGTSEAIIDLGVPEHAAVSLSFEDSDMDGGQLSGTITVSRAVEEGDISHYALYWGENAFTKQDMTPIAVISKSSDIISHSITENTALPDSATHILVYTQNSDGEMGSGISLLIIDLGVPTHAAAGVSFTDTDVRSGYISGNVNITKAENEEDVSLYQLYWGTDPTTKYGTTPIQTIAASGNNVAYTFIENSVIPHGTGYLLVFTRNEDGEMGTGISTIVTDLGPPNNTADGISFIDTDMNYNQIAGEVKITKASDESDVSQYNLYWGSDRSTKLSSTPIQTFTASGENMVHTFAENTAISTDANYLLVYTQNAQGEMPIGISTSLNVGRALSIIPIINMLLLDDDE